MAKTKFLISLLIAFAFVSCDTIELKSNRILDTIRQRQSLGTSTTVGKGDTFSNCCPVTICASCNTSDPFISKFRTIDGTCNNLNKPTLGAINTPLHRLIPADYADGKDVPRGFPNSGVNAPSANVVSTGVFTAQTQDTGNKNDLSVLFTMFGQFLDHDFALSTHPSCTLPTPSLISSPYSFKISRPPKCGSIDAFDYPCFPIDFANVFTPCTPFARTRPICQNVQKKSQRKTRQQANVLTAFIDGSQIYGETVKKANNLRKFDGTGHMKISSQQLLPIETEQNNITCSTAGGCSLVGDVRGDENIGLHTIHTVWVREHNKIATTLKSYNPSWEEEELYQNTRKINIAQLQHIVYNEFLPKITPISAWTGYNSNIDPSISNAFSTAAYRFGHGLIPNFFSQVNSSYNNIFNPILLQDAFLDRTTINARGIEPTMFGMVRFQSNDIDTEFAESISRNLFVPSGTSGHVDLIALNIQRGRDHGLPTYGKYREFCGLPALNNWIDLDTVMPPSVRQRFESVYSPFGLGPKDIDLFAAGISETPATNHQVGATFGCILNNQFDRLRRGDRFYYENPGQFTAAQLNSIKKVTMSSILCRNLIGISTIQRDSFISGTSPLTTYEMCGNIPQLNLQLWGNVVSTLSPATIAKEKGLRILSS